MEKEIWDDMTSMQDWQLLDFVTEKESSQRRHAAEHILAMRRNKVMERVAMWSAIAAALAAIASIAQLFK